MPPFSCCCSGNAAQTATGTAVALHALSACSAAAAAAADPPLHFAHSFIMMRWSGAKTTTSQLPPVLSAFSFPHSRLRDERTWTGWWWSHQGQAKPHYDMWTLFVQLQQQQCISSVLPMNRTVPYVTFAFLFSWGWGRFSEKAPLLPRAILALLCSMRRFASALWKECIAFVFIYVARFVRSIGGNSLYRSFYYAAMAMLWTPPPPPPHHHHFPITNSSSSSSSSSSS